MIDLYSPMGLTFLSLLWVCMRPNFVSLSLYLYYYISSCLFLMILFVLFFTAICYATSLPLFVNSSSI